MFNIPSFYGFRAVSGKPLLLDAYAGAAAAYSLRGLSAAYVKGGTPYACQVRNGSNIAANIGFVYNSITGEYDLDTAALLAHCVGGNGFIDVWYDQSGSLVNGFQINALNQPKIVSAGSIITTNGKPSVEFNGTSSRLALGSNVAYFNFMHNGTKFYDTGVIMTTKSTRNDIYGNVFFGADLGTSAVVNVNNNGTLSFGNGNGNGNIGSVNKTSPSSFLTNTQYLYSHISDNDNAIASDRDEIYINNSVAFKNNTITNLPSAGNSSFVLTLGALSNSAVANLFQGYMQEIIIFSIDQSSNRTGIETNINDYYSIY